MARFQLIEKVGTWDTKNADRLGHRDTKNEDNLGHRDTNNADKNVWTQGH